MIVRRAFYYWQFIAAIVLPAWILIARGILGNGVEWEFVLFVLLCPILAIVMFGVAVTRYARKSVRDAKAVSWLDVAVMGIWHLVIIAYGFFDSSFIAALIVLGAIIAFWIGVWQLYTETRRRVRGVIAGFEQASRTTGQPVHRGPVIVLDPAETRDQP